MNDIGMKIIEEITRQLVARKIQNIESKYLIISDLGYFALKKEVNLYSESNDINKPSILGLIIAVVSTDDKIVEVR